ncbi:MAG: hypothetical protein KIT89_04710 [Microcella sp.]|uniref:hypothetical protein n=1 Tax=Microcella sp. TaxID=1913979 RepID=UPI0024CA4CDE|nr:hypothetical protein [Microcella sp.]UYN84495.1 MAG: hypothetical protein KIT89_04710 [Microcella sp.]
MPTEPGDAAGGDEALNHVVKGLFDAELERLAFGRPQSEGERQKAAAAVRELDRRAAEHAARAGEQAPPAVPDVLAGHSARGASARSALDPAERPWWRRTATIVAASVLLVIVAASLAPLLTSSPVQSSSLAVFAREPSPAELDLRTQLQLDGLRLSASPRVIAERDSTQIVAYRFVTTAPGERPRNEVCVVLVDVRVIGLPACATHEAFARDGLQTTLSGVSNRFVIGWGPSGTPTVSVLPDVDSSLGVPSSPAAEAFFANQPSDDDLANASLLRALHPNDRLIVRVLSTTESWRAVGALVASADTALWSYCVHLLEESRDERLQLGASVTCAGRVAFERDGLVAQARTAESSVLLEWKPDDTVFMQELGRP